MDRVNAIFAKIPELPFRVTTPGGRLLAVVELDSVRIVDEKIIDFRGILIPAVLREEFGGKAIIEHGDPLFCKAFIRARCFDLIRAGYRFTKE